MSVVWKVFGDRKVNLTFAQCKRMVYQREEVDVEVKRGKSVGCVPEDIQSSPKSRSGDSGIINRRISFADLRSTVLFRIHLNAAERNNSK